jgi:hypothetical protein
MTNPKNSSSVTHEKKYGDSYVCVAANPTSAVSFPKISVPR